MIDRRHMLAGLSTMPLLADAVAAQKPAGALIRRKIPKSGEMIPVIGMGTSGTFQVTDPAARAPLVAVLAAFFAAGGSVIDTAPTYGNAETVLGDLLAQGRQRRRSWLASKISRTSGEAARAQFGKTLADLHGDRVELMQVHNLGELASNLAYLRELKAAGKTRYVGITHYVDEAHDELAAIVEREELDFVQFNLSVRHRGAERRLLPACAARGVATMINRTFDDGALFAEVKGKPLPAWAGEIGCASWGQIMLKYVVGHPAVTVVIPATSKVRNMEDNLGAGRGVMPDAAQRRRIAALFA